MTAGTSRAGCGDELPGQSFVMVVMGDDGGGGGGGGETVESLVANQRGHLGLASLTFFEKFFLTLN